MSEDAKTFFLVAAIVLIIAGIFFGKEMQSNPQDSTLYYAMVQK